MVIILLKELPSCFFSITQQIYEPSINQQLCYQSNSAWSVTSCCTSALLCLFSKSPKVV